MVTFMFLVVVGFLIWLQCKREKNLLNLVSVLAVPYLFNVFFNNYFFYQLGFYKINDDVLFMIMGSLIVFFLGTCFVSPGIMPVIHEEDNEKRFSQYDMDKMTVSLIVIAVIGLLRVCSMFVSGAFSGSRFVSAEGVAGSGIIGHLMLLSGSLTPIVFLYWLDHKEKISSLIAVVLMLLLHFSTFIKYHVIGTVISLFIFTLLYKKSFLRKGIFILLSTVILLFTGNYFIGFVLRDMNIDSFFYIAHFWKYTAGSLIYDQYIFDPGLNVDLTLGYKLMGFIMALPNMFTGFLLGNDARMFPYVAMPMLPVSDIGELSNVTDAFGYLYPAKGANVDILLYYLIIFFIGIIFSWIYVKAKENDNYFSPFIGNFLTYFVFLNFFGTFYINSGPWEMLIYSIVIPNLFLRKTNLSEGKIDIL